METVRGRILEIKEKHIVLLSTDGRYLKLPKPDGTIRLGEETELTLQPVANKKWLTSRAVLSAVAAVLILLVFIPGIFTGNKTEQPQFYLSLDINPSVELAVGNDLRVLGYRALNADGERVLAGIAEGADLFYTVNAIIEKATALSYLKGDAVDNLVLLTLAGNVPAELTVTQLENAVHDRLITLGIDGNVGVFEAEDTERVEALNQGTSLNRYLLGKAAGIPEKVPPGPAHSLQEMVEIAGPPVKERMIPVQGLRQKPPGLPAPAGQDSNGNMSPGLPENIPIDVSGSPIQPEQQQEQSEKYNGKYDGSPPPSVPVVPPPLKEGVTPQ